MNPNTDFDLFKVSEDHDHLREAVRAVAEDKIAPHAAEVDQTASFPQAAYDALVASDAVLVPMQCEYFALEGLSRLSDTVSRIRAGANPKLAVAGVLLTMYDPRSNLAREVADEVRKHFRVYETVIPRNIRLAEAPSHGKPVILYDAASRGSHGYLSLARELLSEAA